MDGIKFDEKYVKSVKADDSKVDMTKAGEYQLTYNITGVESKDFIAKDVKVIKKVTVKEKMTEEEKASEEQKTAEAQKQDVKPVIEEKESGNSDKNSSSSKPNNNSSSSSDNSSPSKPNKPAPSEPAKPSKPAHSHDWKTEYKTVHHEAQYRNEPVYKDEIVYEDRPVYKWSAYWTCTECGKRFETEYDAGDHALFECGGGYSAHREQVQTGTEQVQVGTNRVQVGTNPVLVKDAWDEQVPNGQSCSCGARK